MDETFLGGEEPGLRGGRARGKKVLTGIAVEIREPTGLGRFRMAPVPDASAQSLHVFVTDHVEPGSTVITDLLDLSKWPHGSRVIVRRERPHPGAQLRFTDADGHRFTAFLTDTTRGQLADLEVRHRSHARVEDRIRTGKATGLRNLPCRDFAENRVWLELSLAAADLLTWAQALCFTGELARCERRRVRPATRRAPAHAAHYSHDAGR